MLFDELPEQCLVLLEDIDIAELVVRDPKTDPDKTEDNINSMHSSSSRISLSGLLNVIDGIASQEGRLLTMTTNHVKALDDALLRLGRVDVRIHFKLVTKKQAEDLFLQTFMAVDNSMAKEQDNAGVNDLNRMACAFAAEIPEHKLSPAII